MSNVTKYDHRDVYNGKIEKLVKQIKALCVVNKIPFMCTFAVENSEEGTTYVHDGAPATGQIITLKDDLFKKYLLAIRGGKFILPSKLDLEADEDYIGTLFEPDELDKEWAEPEPDETLDEEKNNEEPSDAKFPNDFAFEYKGDLDFE